MRAFNQALKFVNHATAGKTDCRHYLQGVLLDFAGHAVTLVATDSNRMAIAELAQDLPFDGQVILPPSAVKMILGLAPKYVHLVAVTPWAPPVPANRGPASAQPATPSVTLGLDGQTYTFEGENVRYPDWRRVDPVSGIKYAPSEPTTEIGLNAAFISQATAAAGRLCAGVAPSVRLDLHGEHNAVVVSPRNLKPIDGLTAARVIVMPCKL